MNVLEVRNLRKSFEDNLVLHDLSLTVPDHTATVLIGASGSGKSTLLRCINLLDTIDDGSIFLDGREISDPEINVDEVRKNLGMVFQSFNLFPHMSVIDNIMLSPVRVHKKSKEQAREEAMTGGQQQRVAIIRSIAVKPRLLLLDEVTSALDPVLVNEVLLIVRDLKADGMAMVLATHEMGFATQVADEVCFLKDGNIVERGPASQVISAPQQDETKDFLRRVHEAGRL